MTNYFSELEQNVILPSLPAGTLASIQSITIFDLLGSGEINGFPSAIAAGASFGTETYLKAALKDIFLNGTQILKQSANLSFPQADDFNFSPIVLEFRTGTASQAAIKNNLLISQAQTETSVGIEVTKASAVTRSISTACDQLRVTMSFPALQEIKDNGNVEGSAVRILMKITEDDGTEHSLINDLITGKSASVYKRDYGISVTGMDFPISLEVSRFNDDSTSLKIQNKSFFDSFTEIQADSNAYLDSAYTAIRIGAESFGGAVPKRMFRIQGTKISIPHNATVQSDGSLSYAGTFNGTFKAAKEWTNDPAWILYDVLTSSKGLGDHLDSTKIDVYSFYSASVYCAEQVDDMTGTGTTEPRFAFNSVIRGQTSAYNLINKICQTMRAMAFYSAGTIEIVQDSPSDPVYLFNLSNVTEAGFNYTNTSKTTKFTKVNVSYFNMDTQEPDFVSVDDTDLQAKYGVVVKNIKAYGCTSFGQARRFGKWFLYTQNNECEVCNFTTALAAGVIVRPGIIISIADPLRSGIRRGGKISAVNSTTEIVVDDSENTDLATTDAATLSIIMPDGTMETRTISSISGTTITVSSAFSTSPNPNSVWIIENSTVSAQTYRVISVSEAQQTQYSISAVVHNSSKYSNVEDGTSITKKTTSVLNQILPAPENLSVSEQIIVVNGKAIVKIDFAFSTVNNAYQYIIQHRFNNNNFETIETQSTSLELSNTVNGTYEFRVFTQNPLGQLSSQPAELTFEAVGKTEPPEQVTGLTAEVIDSQNVKLSFDKSTSLDVVHGGNVVIKHSVDTSGNASFSNSTTLADNIPGNASEAFVPNISGEFLLKFKDDSGILSTDETSIIVTKPEAQPVLGIQTRREDSDSPPFQGSKDDTFYDSSLDRLLLSGATEFDTVTDVDALSSFDFSGPISSKGIYDFTSILDLGSKFILDLRKAF
jgi:predicted phage tail protein